MVYWQGNNECCGEIISWVFLVTEDFFVIVVAHFKGFSDDNGVGKYLYLLLYTYVFIKGKEY